MLTALLRFYPYLRPVLPRSIRVRAITWFADLRSRLIGRSAFAVLTDGYNGTLLVPSRDVGVAWRLAEFGSYDEDRIEFLKSRIGPGSEVLIVGAHVGALLVPLAKVAARAVGVEPNPEVFRLLEMNVRLNGLTNVEIFNFAAGDRSGEVDFLAAQANSGASRLSFSHLRDRTWWDASSFAPRAPAKLRVPMRRLDEVFAGRTFDLVIMDIEGAEFTALPGMVNVLGRAETLQVEILPLYLKSIARITTSEAVKHLGSRFNSAVLISRRGRSPEFSKTKFEDLAAEIDRQGGGDVVFFGPRTDAVAA